MSYAQKITEKKFRNGRLLATRFPAGGSVSIAGSARLAQKVGEDELADVHAQMLLEGTSALDKRALQAALDAMGASLSFSSTDHRLRFSGRVQEKYLSRLIDLILEILLNPSFPADELAILKKREQANLTLTLQNTGAQANGALSRLLFTKNHPNYTQPTKEHISALKKITPLTLKKFHARLSADTLVCSMAGDLNLAKVFSLMEKAFSLLPHSRIALSAPAPAKAQKAHTVAVAIKNKASIDYRAGSAARITNNHKDFPALLIGLQVLGNRSGFTGRLMNIVREQEGLTYGVYSYPIGFAGDRDGYSAVAATFAPQLFKRGRASILREVKRIVEEGVDKEELRKHTGLFEARSRVTIASSGAFARAAHDTVVDGKKISYLDDFPKKILRLTKAQVDAALKKYLDPSKLSESAAGPIEKF